MKYNSTVWRNKETKKFLIYNERDTHTGNHIDIKYTYDIEEATIARYLKPMFATKNNLEPVSVIITKEVRVIQK